MSNTRYEIDITEGAKLVVYVSPKDKEIPVAIEIIYPDVSVTGYLNIEQLDKLREILR